MYQTHDYPTSWKDTFIHFIKKPDSEGMRPIALTSCVCKLFEVIVTNRIQWWIEHQNLLPNNQTGFQKGHSCSDNLTTLAINIDMAFSNNEDVLTAFLDVSGAFDNVNSDILLEKLAKLDCSEYPLHFYKFLTYERNITAEILEGTFRKVNKGVPQGGPSSALLHM